MKYYKIEKYFGGGHDIYYAKMSNNKKISKSSSRYQLQEWGDNTNGGQCNGYRIDMKRIKSLPKGEKVFLQFADYYLEPNKKKNK